MKRQLIAASLMLPQFLLAQQISGFSAERDSVAVNEPVKLVVEFIASDRSLCGLRLSFGDGELRELRVEQTPVTLTKQFAFPGRYAVRVEGQTILRGLKTVFACAGEPRTVMLGVVDPAEKQLQSKLRDVDSKLQALADKDRQVRAREIELERRERQLKELETNTKAAAAPAQRSAGSKVKDDTLTVF